MAQTVLLLQWVNSSTNIVDMNEQSLSDFLQNGGRQTDVSEALNVTQGAVSQMLKAGRDIRVQTDSEGNVLGVYEIKPLGRSAV